MKIIATATISAAILAAITANTIPSPDQVAEPGPNGVSSTPNDPANSPAVSTVSTPTAKASTSPYATVVPQTPPKPSLAIRDAGTIASDTVKPGAALED